MIAALLLLAVLPKMGWSQCRSDTISFSRYSERFARNPVLDLSNPRWPCTGPPIDTIIIEDLAHIAPPPWFCSTTFDTQYVNNSGDTLYDATNHFKNANYTMTVHSDSFVYVANIHPVNGSIESGGFGWMTLCVCCGQGRTAESFQITVKHRLSSTSMTTGSLSPLLYSPPCSGSYRCTETCDGLVAAVSSVDNEKHLCVTVTRDAAGDMYGFGLEV